MACVNCSGGSKSYVTMPCEVCIQNDNDSDPKEVWWCGVCNAYICKAHEGQWVQRAKAAVKKKYKAIKKPS